MTKPVQIINQKKFVPMALDPDKEAFVVYTAYLNSKMTIYSTWEAQIALLITKKIVIPAEYLDFANAFWEESAAELSKRFDYNKHSINLKSGKQTPYKSIYNQG